MQISHVSQHFTFWEMGSVDTYVYLVYISHLNILECYVVVWRNFSKEIYHFNFSRTRKQGKGKLKNARDSYKTPGACDYKKTLKLYILLVNI